MSQVSVLGAEARRLMLPGPVVAAAHCKTHQKLEIFGNFVASRSAGPFVGRHFLLERHFAGKMISVGKARRCPFNNTLTWNDHVSNVYSTCARMLGILRRLDGNISPLCMRMERIYKTAIRSRMEYACAVWSGGSKRSLQRLQDSFAKRLGLTLPPLKNRFNYHTLVLFYKIRQNLAPKYLCTLVPDLSSITSGYSFRKFSYSVSNLGKFFTPSFILHTSYILTGLQKSK